MDNLIIYNITTKGPDVLSIVTELSQATSQPYSYILQLLFPVVILVVMLLYIRTKPLVSSLVDYGRKQKANTPQSSNIWDEKAIQRSLKELGKKLEDMVLMPDLFVSWAAEPPRINPHYQEVKNEAEQWFGKTCGHDDRLHSSYVAADFPYFSAIWAPAAGQEEYRMTCDWTNWVFAFDDRIDEGELKNKSEETEIEIMETLSLMGSSPTPYSREGQPVRYVFDLIWQRFSKKSPEGSFHALDVSKSLFLTSANAAKGLKRRFIKTHRDYCYEISDQTDVHWQDGIEDLETYINRHRISCGVYPILPIIEYCHGLDLPDYVFENSSILRLQELTAELVKLTNDIYSYVREHASGDDHNLIKLLRRKGMSQQEAYNFAGDAVKKRYYEWYVELSKVPRWGEEVDMQVQTYIRGCQGVVLANLNWSFRSQRYFGKGNELARRSRLVPAVW